LIKLSGALRIYLDTKRRNRTGSAAGKLDFDVNSFAADAGPMEEQDGRRRVVVDLGPISRLMTIKGNWDSQKGRPRNTARPADPSFPSPQIEFAKELQPRSRFCKFCRICRP